MKKVEERQKILIADDQETNRYGLARLLTSAGYEVIEAENGKQLLEKFDAEHPDLIITDVQMPIMDGFEAARQLRLKPEAEYIPIIIVSATFMDISSKLKGLDMGGNDYITQPFNPDEMLAKVKAMLRVKKLYDQLRDTKLKLEQYAETQEILLQEVNHRVKNNLSAIISLIHIEEERLKTMKLTEQPLLSDLAGKISGLATVHNMLSDSNWQPLKLHQLCRNIISASLKSISNSKPADIQVNSSPVTVDSDQAHHLALIINELTVNSVKHNLKNRDNIIIRVEIEQHDNKVSLHFHDNGPGYPKEMLDGDTTKDSGGFNLIRGIVRKSLNGQVLLDNDKGAKTTITFEIP